MIDNLLQQLSTLLAAGTWLAPVLALLGGILTSFTPCSLSTVPLVVGCVGGGGEQSGKRAFRLSCTFALGSAIAFTVLGVVASLAGGLIGGTASWWYMLLGVLMLLMALQTWEIYEFIPSGYLMEKNKKTGYVGALLAGVLGAVFSSPCATPMLVVLLAAVAGGGSLGWGILLLLFYSIGHGVLAVVCGTSVGFVQKLSQSERYGKVSRVLKIIMGALIALIGFYMFYLAF